MIVNTFHHTFNEVVSTLFPFAADVSKQLHSSHVTFV